MVQSRLDFWLIHESLQEKVNENDIIPCVLSDHAYVTLNINVNTKRIGPSYWKFNNSLLNDKEYVETLTSNYNDWIEEFPNKNDKSRLWDWLKFKIRAFTIH